MLNKKSHVNFTLLYFFLAIIYIIIFRILNFESRIEAIVKTVPIWLLFLIAFNPLKNFKGGRFLLLGLLFGSAGDFVLSSRINHSFMIGLILFLAGHIFYIVAFIRVFKFRPFRMIPAGIVSFSIILIVYYLNPFLVEMKIPVYAYITVIYLMTLSSVFRNSSYPAVFTGAFIFMISDSILAFNKFASAGLPDYMVMLTYYSAQYLVIFGSISDSEIKSVLKNI